MERDRLGRRRSPEQERGLRPLHPPLPEEWISKALRVAMSESDWAHFAALVSRRNAMAPSQARAYGLVLSELLQAVPRPDPSIDTLTTEHKKYLESWETGT
jgi:hypothetical protein